MLVLELILAFVLGMAVMAAVWSADSKHEHLFERADSYRDGRSLQHVVLNCYCGEVIDKKIEPSIGD